MYWAIDFKNPAIYADAENQTPELLTGDFNRASVIIWSVGNQNADTDERLQFMKRLATTVRANDPTRLISAACLVNHEKVRIEDRHSGHLDVIGLNEYYGWYKPDIRELEVLIDNSAPQKPVIITEFGAGAKAGHHGSIHEMFTEENMENLYRNQIETIRRISYIKGLAPWILHDFTCPRRQNRFQRGYNRKGLIARGQGDEEARLLHPPGLLQGDPCRGLRPALRTAPAATVPGHESMPNSTALPRFSSPGRVKIPPRLSATVSCRKNR